MVTATEGKIIDFISNSQQGKLIQKEGMQTQKLKIGDKTYRYDKNKPFVKTLQAPCRNWVAVLRSCWCCFTSSIDRHLAQDTIEVQDLMCDCIHT